MEKIFFVLLFSLVSCMPLAFCDEIEIDSEVITVNPELEFFIIKAGEDKGVELGDGLIVHRGAEKIAEAYIVEVRPDISTAEILKVSDNEEIRKGDSVLIVKEEAPAKGPSRKLKRTVKKHRLKWAPILGRPEGIQEVSTTVPGTKAAMTPQPGSSYIPNPAVKEKEDVVTADIKSPRNQVFAYARLVLREDGFSIISSNRAVGLLVATKPIALPIMKELWADAVAAIGHKLVVNLKIKDQKASSELIASAFKEHFQKERYIKAPVLRGSKYYNDLMVLVSKIKEDSEY